MIEVTAAIARASPNLRSQIAAARSIGSNGRSSGLRTALPYRRTDAGLVRYTRRTNARLVRYTRRTDVGLVRYTRRPADHVLDTRDYGKLYSLLGEHVTET